MSVEKMLVLVLAVTILAVLPAAPCAAQESSRHPQSAASVVVGSSESHLVPQDAPRGTSRPAIQDGGAYSQREALSQDLEQFYGGNAGLIIVIAVIVAIVVIVAILIPW